MTGTVDNSAERADFRRAVQSVDPSLRPLLAAIAAAWDATDNVGEGEARRWSPVVAAAVALTAGEAS